MTDTPADPLDEAIEAVARVLLDDGWTCEYHEPDAECGECARQHRLTATAAVRAAAPIIAAPIQRVVADLSQDLSELMADRKALRAERDLAQRGWDEAIAALTECVCSSWPPEGPDPSCAVHGAIRALNEANVELADLRARLATAERERDELRTLANAVLATFVHPGHPGRACLQSGWIDVDTVQQWRERAKEANHG